MVSLSLLLALFYVYTYFENPFITVFAEDTMTPSQRLKVGQTLVSAAGKFELGFFSPLNKKGIRYLGIWYMGISPQTVVWVANTRKPLQSKNAILQLKPNGALVLFDNPNRPIYIFMPAENVSNPALRIYDSGNLVVVHNAVTPLALHYFWQSFNQPSDTLLPTMNLGFYSGRNLVLTSWKKDDDPSPGEFTFGLDKPQLPQLLLKRKSIKVSRWGPWEGVRFSGSDIFDSNQFIYPHFKTSHFQFNPPEEYLVRLQVNPRGKIQFLLWNNSNSKWNPFMTLNKDRCDNYNACGPFGICHVGRRTCHCLKGFVPNNAQNQRGIAHVPGCKRDLELKCDAGDGFKRFTDLKLPDNGVVWPNLSPIQCENRCLQNCSCNAYSYIDVYENGSNCVVWFGGLLDMRYLPERGDDVHIRMVVYNSHSIPGGPIVLPKTDKKKNLIVVTIVSSLCVLVFSVLLLFCWFKRQSTRRLASWSELSTGAIRVNPPRSRLPVFVGANPRLNQQRPQQRDGSNTEEENSDFRLFEVDIISEATNNFSNANKIGEGGFGPVYKGVLHNGREIAVKRLSRSSAQGQEQFENESSLVARLQHRNLVKLVGCCVHELERMLIYEYLPNKSLDRFLFDQSRKMLLTWAMRVDIILGVAKGLAYLHDDSGLRIVHRDLKASNILLDCEMTPKISDFGLAMILGDENELTERSIKVYGTLGYLSPEYAMSGQFSAKSDVFSFGVLVLEIVSGKKNWGFRHHDSDTNLLGHAWNLWSRGNALEMMDPAIGDLSSETQIIRCIQIGLLCVQHNPEQRPTMSTIVAMLNYDSMVLPEPTAPGFFPESSLLSSTDDSAMPPSVSFNGLTITTLNPR